ncbi:MAG TPA: tetratricopeptide repeat protein [Candidatus Sulfotelmatobacter sp.]|nr:tetratricopeptide repeat protein [Candidatus Sulfotelmatobacter sp.]
MRLTLRPVSTHLANAKIEIVTWVTQANRAASFRGAARNRCVGCRRGVPFVFVLLSLLVAGWPLTRAQTAPNPANGDLDRQFQQAVSQYESGRYPESAAILEKLLPSAPESFELHELLGLVYSAQSQDAKASEHLEKAARLNPKSAEAHTNLAANLVRLGKNPEAERQFRKAVELEPDNFDTNHNLGELYIRQGKIADAMPYLEKAQRLDGTNYDNGYDLALAYISVGRTKDARALIQTLLLQRNTAELHNLAAEVEEKDGNFVVAANEYETAAHMDPSEGNLFDWASELLVHRTLGPSITIFRDAVQRYPQSARLAIGLGMALYSLGKYDDAVASLLRAADLSPKDARIYPFLSRAYDSSPGQADEVIKRFRRFAELQPRNGRAQYYYAMSMWKGKRAQDPSVDLHEVEALLKKSIAFDPSLAEAQLQLGNLYSDQSHYTEAIPYYKRAIALNSDLADAHYRLGQAYVRTNQKDLAQPELQRYQQLRAQHLADLDKQRAEVRQFVTSSKDSAPPASPDAKP